MAKPEIFSLRVEKHVLGGLIKHPQFYPEIDGFISENDFFQPVHKTLFCVIKSILAYGGALDKILLGQKIKELGIAVKDNVDIFDYISDISFTQITIDGIKKACQELVKLRIRRELVETAEEIMEAAHSMGEKTVDEIIAATDKVYNSRIASYGAADGPVDMFANIKEICEERAKSPIMEIGLKTPFPNFNRMFGGIRSGNGVYAVVSRPKHGKSTWLLKMAQGCVDLNPGLKVLYLDTEMKTEVGQFRAASAITQIPMWHLETGRWAQNGILSEKFKKTIDSTQKYAGKIFHMNVVGRPLDDILSIIRRWYFSEVGRGGKAMAIYDYIKMTGETVGQNWSEHQIIGEKITQLNAVGTDLDMPIWTACQMNRQGEDGKDDSSAIALSDRLQWYAAFVAIFRRKRLEELAQYGTTFGSHLMIPLATRFQGETATGHLDAVRVPVEGKRKPQYMTNFINFDIQNFDVTEKGTLEDIVRVKVKLTKPADDSDGKLLP